MLRVIDIDWRRLKSRAIETPEYNKARPIVKRSCLQPRKPSTCSARCITLLKFATQRLPSAAAPTRQPEISVKCPAELGCAEISVGAACTASAGVGTTA